MGNPVVAAHCQKFIKLESQMVGGMTVLWGYRVVAMLRYSEMEIFTARAQHGFTSDI